MAVTANLVFSLGWDSNESDELYSALRSIGFHGRSKISGRISSVEDADAVWDVLVAHNVRPPFCFSRESFLDKAKRCLASAGKAAAKAAANRLTDAEREQHAALRRLAKSVGVSVKRQSGSGGCGHREKGWRCSSSCSQPRTAGWLVGGVYVGLDVDSANAAIDALLSKRAAPFLRDFLGSARPALAVYVKPYGKPMLPFPRLPEIDEFLVGLGVQASALLYDDDRGCYLLPWNFSKKSGNGWWTAMEALVAEGIALTVKAECLADRGVSLAKDVCSEQCADANPDNHEKCSCACGGSRHGQDTLGDFFYGHHFHLDKVEDGVEHRSMTLLPNGRLGTGLLEKLSSRI